MKLFYAEKVRPEFLSLRHLRCARDAAYGQYLQKPQQKQTFLGVDAVRENCEFRRFGAGDGVFRQNLVLRRFGTVFKGSHLRRCSCSLGNGSNPCRAWECLQGRFSMSKFVSSHPSQAVWAFSELGRMRQQEYRGQFGCPFTMSVIQRAWSRNMRARACQSSAGRGALGAGNIGRFTRGSDTVGGKYARAYRRLRNPLF